VAGYDGHDVVDDDDMMTSRPKRRRTAEPLWTIIN
jgi:hypothetical protein